MENLDKLTAAGLPLYDLNMDNLERTAWSDTVLGSRDDWPIALTVLVNSCILPTSHCAALFWGPDLCCVHNLAWGKSQGDVDGQGKKAHDLLRDEALSAISTALRGRTLKVAGRFFLDDLPRDHPDTQISLSTIVDEKGERKGVLAQILENSKADKYVPISGLTALAEKKPARQTKESGSQQTHSDSTKNSDSRQTQLFQRFAELLPNGLAILDQEAEAIFVNDGFFSLTTNKTQNEFRAWPESIHEEDYERVMSAYREAFNNREELKIEFRCSVGSSGGDAEWRMFLIRPLSDDLEAGFICAVVDVTDIKAAQLAQEKAATQAQERKEQQERFIDMVSHEIRNPLSAVLHLAEEVKDLASRIGERNGALREQVADVLDAADTILLCISHMNTLVDDILSFSKLDSMMLSLVPRDVRPKWEFSKSLKVFHSEFKAKQIKFHYALDTSYKDLEIDHVVADLNRIKQVLLNLITNAIKFTAKKQGERSITVSMGASIHRPTSYPPSVIFFGQDENAFHMDSTMTPEWGTGDVLYIMVAVEDTGIGISKVDQEKLFERFRQATPKTQEKYGGSGLGLFISRKLCQLHGGDIGVSSIEGSGSTFGFFFKVRRSVGINGDARPPFAKRGSSQSQMSSQQQRPSVSRAASSRAESRPKIRRPDNPTLSSHSGVDADDVEKSLKDPPVENRPTARANAQHHSERYEETKGISDTVQNRKSSVSEAVEKRAKKLEEGETTRQAAKADELTKTQIQDNNEKRKVLLLVEDNLINQKVLRRQLQSRGFEVIVANNGQEAIDAVAEREKQETDESDHHDHFDCILMDQEMPVKDGNTATREIRDLQRAESARYSPILGVSANVRDEQTRSMKDAGMDDVISKPFKVDDLVKRIEGLILSPRTGSG